MTFENGIKYNLPYKNAESPTLTSRTFLFNPISLKCQNLIINTKNIHCKYKSYFYSCN